jgi:hypothetical protein
MKPSAKMHGGLGGSFNLLPTVPRISKIVQLVGGYGGLEGLSIMHAKNKCGFGESVKGMLENPPTLPTVLSGEMAAW